MAAIKIVIGVEVRGQRSEGPNHLGSGRHCKDLACT